ncbi:MAG: hypothetical protein ACI4R9_00700 [Kiritimatiellia bacterium]
MTTNKSIILCVAEERSHNRKENDKRPDFHFDFEPSDFKDYARTESELIEVLGRKWKSNLTDIGRFCFEYQTVTSNYFKTNEEGVNHDVSIYPISCKNSNLLLLFKNPSTVSRMLKKCRKIGLLVRMNTDYCFGNVRKSRNYCYHYAYNKSVEHLVIDVCKKKGINLEERKNEDTIVSTFAARSKISCEDKNRITLKTSRIGLVGYDNEDGEEAIKDYILHEKYEGLIAPRELKIKSMNKDLPRKQMIRFAPNLKYNKKGRLISIGLRATNEIVSLKAHENEHPNYRGMMRPNYLKQYFGTGEYTSYDVRASIYQISHLLNFGEWMGNGHDPYQMMFGESFARPEDREAYKSFCMALYFDNPNVIYAHNRLFIPCSVEQYGRDAIKKAILESEESMRKFTGEKFFNEVFLHESLLYIDFVYELRMRGIEVVQIYDGFYLRQGVASEEELEGLMRECAMRYLQDYRGWLKAANTYEIAA